ncbi:MAG: aminotransferase class III-fold pyridoxal phosphate-dependent enzyme [Gammaproteobacteria bacterium]|nr:aminotransferase class III-fold pyridoxal phosphate-dependent enzyme [Gammaproteobacteria bacterium]
MTLAPQALIERERLRFAREHPRSAALAGDAVKHFPGAVPMHWMADWGTPFPLFIATGHGVELEDVDGRRYHDFCLGDTGAMFGHSPAAVVAAVTEQAGRGLTCMLPSARTAAVGAALAARFSLPYWQLTQTATDANRAALRWARAITGRRKVLVFQGCYHGTVDETMVRLRGGRTVTREGAIGPAFDGSTAALAVEFNDFVALEAALAAGDIAAVLAEPVMTNIGMVLPQEGYLRQLRELTRRHDALLIIDETHTLSSGPAGYAGEHALQPDLWVCGKAIAGGIPCAVYGFTDEVEARMRAVLATREAGHSGMGTTLAGNALTLAALEAALLHLHTSATHAPMQAGAHRLATQLLALFIARGLPWHVSRVGARVEFGFAAAPRNGSEAEAAMRPVLEHALHLWLLNRGLIVTPFHNMMLIAPMQTDAVIDALVSEVGAFLDEVTL